MNFVVLSTSRGTTFQAILDRIGDGSLSMRCLGLVTDRKDRGCVAKAETAGLPWLAVDADPKIDRAAFDKTLDQKIRKLLSDAGAKPSDTVIAEMGWMWIHTPAFIEEWKNRILNVHPALLPKYGGKGMYGTHVHDAVLASGDRKSGITIHVMDQGVDTGPILLQKECPVLSGDAPETLQARAQELEKEWYPKVLEMIERDTIALPS